MFFDEVQQAALDEFGVPITVTPAGGSATVVRGIFRVEHEAVDPVTMAPVLVDQPVVDVMLSEMPGGDIKRNDVVQIEAATYRVTEVRKDGEGMAKVRLQEQ